MNRLPAFSTVLSRSSQHSSNLGHMADWTIHPRVPLQREGLRFSSALRTKVPARLYHLTPVDRWDGIQRSGLEPSPDCYNGGAVKGVFLFDARDILSRGWTGMPDKPLVWLLAAIMMKNPGKDIALLEVKMPTAQRKKVKVRDLDVWRRLIAKDPEMTREKLAKAYEIQSLPIAKTPDSTQEFILPNETLAPQQIRYRSSGTPPPLALMIADPGKAKAFVATLFAKP